MTEDETRTPAQRWLAATWPFVHEHLPPPPVQVLELGCGPLGGFVPAMRAAGYDAVGIDPDAPTGPGYHQAEFEQYELKRPVNAIVACTSLHHVSDLREVIDRIASALLPGGVLVVVEWTRERFDEATAQWCFNQLATTDEPGWLERHRDAWRASDRSWDAYCTSWADSEGLHTGRDILLALRTRFDTRLLREGPYFFADLIEVTAAQEQGAIDSGQIRATGLHYVGVLQDQER